MSTQTANHIEILRNLAQGADENAATSRDRSLPEDDRRHAAQAADSAWRAITKVSERLAAICQQEGDVLEPELLALDEDDFSPRAMELSSLSIVWSDLARDMAALSLRAAGNTNAERQLDAQIADI